MQKDYLDLSNNFDQTKKDFEEEKRTMNVSFLLLIFCEVK